MKKKPVIIIATILVLLILAGLWYTRPRSWADITGECSATSLAATLCVFGLEPTETQTALYIDTWNLETANPGDPAFDAVLAQLEKGTYRASLRNLLPGNGLSESGTTGSITLSIVFDDGSFQPATISSFGTLIGGRNARIYHAGSGLFDDLCDVLQTYGTNA